MSKDTNTPNTNDVVILLSKAESLEDVIKVLQTQYVFNKDIGKLNDQQFKDILVHHCIYKVIDEHNLNNYSDSGHFKQFVIFVSAFYYKVYSYIVNEQMKTEVIEMLNKVLDIIVDDYISNDQHTIVDIDIEQLPECIDKEHYYIAISKYYSMLSHRWIVNNKQYMKTFIEEISNFIGANMYYDGIMSRLKLNLYLIKKVLNA